MPTRGEHMSTRRQKRAPMACDFCRYRKTKCSNEKPRCQNCKEQGKECVYVELTKKPRPSIARISNLEIENRLLQESISNLKEKLESVTISNAGSGEANKTCHITNPIIPISSPSTTLHTIVAPQVHRTFSPDQGSFYHGLTSAAFDEGDIEPSTRHKPPDDSIVPYEWVKRQLVAESVKQRQLETVNFLTEKLDFDQVEPELGMHLLSIYWNRQQSLGPVVYRTAFMRDMACGGRHFSKLLLNAIYFYASKYTKRVEVCQDPTNRLTAGWVYRRRVIELLNASYGASNITTIQALLLMSTAIFAWCDEKSISWLYAGMAFNMIIDLGMHVDTATMKRQFSAEDVEIRIRVFWSAFMIDKLQSLYQGRPAYLHEFATNLPISFLDDHEELELFDPLSYTESGKSFMSPVYSISTFTESCKLTTILDKILMSLYAEKSGRRDPGTLLRESQNLQRDLENWRKSLPPHLDVNLSSTVRSIPLPHTLSLLAMFNVLIILLHRPFVSDGHLHSTSSSIAFEAFSICSAAAFEIDTILKTYGQSFSHKTTPYVVSYATYVSATIHVRLAAQRKDGSDAHNALRRCLEVLDIHQSVCWAPRIAKRVINGLMTRMGVIVDQTDYLASKSDFVLSDSDIDAIIQTFAPDEPPTQPYGRQSVMAPSVVHTSPCFMNDTAYLQSQDLVNKLNPISENAKLLTENDMEFIYDPIFGFNGAVFDDLNFNIG